MAGRPEYCGHLNGFENYELATEARESKIDTPEPRIFELDKDLPFPDRWDRHIIPNAQLCTGLRRVYPCNRLGLRDGRHG